MIVVSDNSPLQYLVLIGCDHVLPALYGQVLTTPQVVEELQQPAAPQALRSWCASLPAWLKVEAPEHVDFLDALDIGEASAISLAREKQAQLILIDERAGTETARNVGLQAVGTLGVLIDAGLEKLIDFEDALARLHTQTSFYASPRLIEAARNLFQRRLHGLDHDRS